jgi:hypothetical protein
VAVDGRRDRLTDLVIKLWLLGHLRELLLLHLGKLNVVAVPPLLLNVDADFPDVRRVL